MKIYCSFLFTELKSSGGGENDEVRRLQEEIKSFKSRIAGMWITRNLQSYICKLLDTEYHEILLVCSVAYHDLSLFQLKYVRCTPF